MLGGLRELSLTGAVAAAAVAVWVSAAGPAREPLAPGAVMHRCGPTDTLRRTDDAGSALPLVHSAPVAPLAMAPSGGGDLGPPATTTFDTRRHVSTVMLAGRVRGPAFRHTSVAARAPPAARATGRSS